MRGVALAVLSVGLLVGWEAEPFQPYLEPPPAEQEQEQEQVEVSAESEALLRRLAAHGEALRQLEAEAALYSEAERLGVAAAVQASGLPARQQRRLALAIVREARRHGLDPLLVVALIRCESSFNPYAVSSVGAMGLMQVMPATGSWLADKAGLTLGPTANLFDLELNVELGTRYLAELLERFGSLEAALVAYNAGPGNARRILSQRERRERFLAGYPARVLHEWRRLRASKPAPQHPRPVLPTAEGQS